MRGLKSLLIFCISTGMCQILSPFYQATHPFSLLRYQPAKCPRRPIGDWTTYWKASENNMYLHLAVQYPHHITGWSVCSVSMATKVPRVGDRTGQPVKGEFYRTLLHVFIGQYTSWDHFILSLPFSHEHINSITPMTLNSYHISING